MKQAIIKAVQTHTHTFYYNTGHQKFLFLISHRFDRCLLFEVLSWASAQIRLPVFALTIRTQLKSDFSFVFINLMKLSSNIIEPMRLRGENILGMSSHDIPPTHSSDHVIFGTFICFKTVSHAANRCYFKQAIKLFQNCVICLVAEIAISSFLRQLDIFLFRKQNKNKTRIIQTRQRFVLILIIDFSEIVVHTTK